MLKKIITAGIIISSLLIGELFAFWSLPIVRGFDHSRITTKGLSVYRYEVSSDFYKKDIEYNLNCTLGKCKFPGTSLTQILDANEGLDYGSQKNLDPQFHCDDEKISLCSGIVYRGGQQIINDLLKAIQLAKQESYSPSSYFLRLRRILGKRLHTLQDFYSHSNWVEREIYGKKGKIRLNDEFKKRTGSVSVNTRFFMEEGYAPRLATNTNTCVTGPDWKDTSITPRYNDLYLDNITTGYYHKSNNIYTYPVYCNISGLDTTDGSCIIDDNRRPLGYAQGASVYYPPEVSGEYSASYDGPYFTSLHEKCIHSGSPTSKNIFATPYIGIAKDHIDSLHHMDAADVAVRATHDYVKYIIDQVIEREGRGIYTDWAILNFLSGSYSLPPVDAPTGNNQNEYTVYGGDIDFSGGFSDMPSSYTLLGKGSGEKIFNGTYKYYTIANVESESPILIDAVQGSDGTYFGTGTTSNTGDSFVNLNGAPDEKYVSIGDNGYILIDASNENLSSLKVFGK